MAAKRWGGREDIPFEVVAETFVLPIVEASSKLGICSATLKRVCKEHGIPRWPYRKVMAGKAIEEIKSEAEAGLAKAREERGLAALGGGHAVSHLNSGTKRLIVKLKGQNVAQSSVLTQFPNGPAGSLPPQAFSTFSPHRNHPPDHPYPFPTPLPNSKRVAIEQRRNLHSFLDEFRCGFPSQGLAEDSSRWWGGGGATPREHGGGGGRRATRREEAAAAVTKEEGFGGCDRVREEAGQSQEKARESANGLPEERVGHGPSGAGEEEEEAEDGDGAKGGDLQGTIRSMGGDTQVLEVMDRADDAGEMNVGVGTVEDLDTDGTKPGGDGGLGRQTREEGKAGFSYRGERRPSTELVLKRKRAGERGRIGVDTAVARGYGVGPLESPKDRAVLGFVFEEYCPRLWSTGLSVDT